MTEATMHDPFDVPPQFEKIGPTEIAFRKIGQGEPLLFLHGWPLSSRTFRKLAPAFAERYTCYLIDIPGAGESKWTEETDFGFKSQAQALRDLVDRLGLRSYSLLGQDSGGLIARRLALIGPPRGRK